MRNLMIAFHENYRAFWKKAGKEETEAIPLVEFFPYTPVPGLVKLLAHISNPEDQPAVDYFCCRCVELSFPTGGAAAELLELLKLKAMTPPSMWKTDLASKIREVEALKLKISSPAIRKFLRACLLCATGRPLEAVSLALRTAPDPVAYRLVIERELAALASFAGDYSWFDFEILHGPWRTLPETTTDKDKFMAEELFVVAKAVKEYQEKYGAFYIFEKDEETGRMVLRKGKSYVP